MENMFLVSYTIMIFFLFHMIQFSSCISKKKNLVPPHKCYLRHFLHTKLIIVSLACKFMEAFKKQTKSKQDT